MPFFVTPHGSCSACEWLFLTRGKSKLRDIQTEGFQSDLTLLTQARVERHLFPQVMRNLFYKRKSFVNILSAESNYWLFSVIEFSLEQIIPSTCTRTYNTDPYAENCSKNVLQIYEQGIFCNRYNQTRSGVALFLSMLHIPQGIYTSDSLEKSMFYMDYSGTGFVLLCEVSSEDCRWVKTKFHFDSLKHYM